VHVLLLSPQACRLAFLVPAVLAVGCATRIPIPDASRAEVRSVQQSIRSVSPAEIEHGEALRYWEIYLTDPDVQSGLAAEDQATLDRIGHRSAAELLEQDFRKSGTGSLDVVRLSPSLFRWLAGQASGSPDSYALEEAAQAVEYLQSFVHRRIADVGYRVVAASDRPTARIVSEPVVGANALVPVRFGANEAYVGTEIALLADSDDELACVVGHELAHLTEGHSTEGAWLELGKQTLSAIATGATVAALAYANPDQPLTAQEIQGALAMGELTSFLLADVPFRIGGWSRGQEREADAIGVYYVWKAGFDPRACETFMLRMAEYELAHPATGGFGWWKTHPPAAERVVRMRKLVPRLERGEVELSDR
jgi:hypothetical protein